MMSKLNTLFRKKIGLPEEEKITFETLDTVLERAATTFPFENLCILSHKIGSITQDNLIQKMLVRNEGGLCYELNPLLYFFLAENGFHVSLFRGDVYDHAKKDWYSLDRTHVAILLQHEGQAYLVDTGFGGNVPLKPVPLTGETVSSRNGEFRVKALKSVYGDYVLEMKLRYKDTDWKVGYTFDLTRLLEEVSELNKVQEIIAGHEESPFNKTPLISKLTSDGNVTLTSTSFTQWIHGESKKEQIDDTRFKELARQHFGFHKL